MADATRGKCTANPCQARPSSTVRARRKPAPGSSGPRWRERERTRDVQPGQLRGGAHRLVASSRQQPRVSLLASRLRLPAQFCSRAQAAGFRVRVRSSSSRLPAAAALFPRGRGALLVTRPRPQQQQQARCPAEQPRAAPWRRRGARARALEVGAAVQDCRQKAAPQGDAGGPPRLAPRSSFPLFVW
jgi:hypothetical protein